jgi:hypothetical protein
MTRFGSPADPSNYRRYRRLFASPQIRTGLVCPFHKGRVPHTPGFPVKFGGVDALHAGFIKESRMTYPTQTISTGNPGEAQRQLLFFRPAPAGCNGRPARDTV